LCGEVIGSEWDGGTERCCKSSVVVNGVARYGAGVRGLARFYVAVKGVVRDGVLMESLSI